MSRLTLLFFLATSPVLLLAEANAPSIGYTGAPTDHGGQNCSTCHTGSAVNGPNGSLTVNTSDYSPGVQQMIRITVQDAQASRWGFQITIRQVSDETQSAGSFSASDFVKAVCDDVSQFGSAPPCTTARQFGEHNNAPRGVTGAAFQFVVPWSPPDQEVGKLHLYVSAVAANGDGQVLGDRVYTFSSTLPNVGGCSFTRPATVRTAVNAGSFQPPFSSNAMVSIFGTGFQASGRTRTAALGDFDNGAFPTVLGCISVQVTGPGITQPRLLPITYVQQDQINVQMPAFTGSGAVNLSVILNAGKSNQLPPSEVATLGGLQSFAPAFFLLGTSTSIAAQFGNTADVVARPSVIPGARPARPGDIVTLYGTGFGDTNPSVPAGQLATGISRLTNPISVTIGGTTLAQSDISYAGLSPGSISGLYQFNVRIPTSTPSGDIQVTITIGQSQTQTVATIPIQP